MKKSISIAFALFAALTVGFADDICSISYQPKDKVIFEKYCEYIKPFTSHPIPELIIKSAQFFLDTPYEGGTCELIPERLVINLHEFDCVTLVESCFALSRMAKSGTLTWQQYGKELTHIRYRGGKMTDYTSRLHYSTDWIYDNAEKKQVSDINKKIGGDRLVLDLSFMSQHPDAYPALKETPSFIPVIESIEKNINGRTYYYIPKEKFEKLSTGIKSGDIIFFTTNIKGLDVIHAGIAYYKDNVLTFIDASSKYNKVVIENMSILEYLKQRKPATGIIIARPL